MEAEYGTVGNVFLEEETEEGTYGQELLEGLYEAGAELEDGAKEKVGDEWPFPTIAVGEDAKNRSANGAEEESESDGRRL